MVEVNEPHAAEDQLLSQVSKEDLFVVDRDWTHSEYRVAVTVAEEDVLCVEEDLLILKDLKEDLFVVDKDWMRQECTVAASEAVEDVLCAVEDLSLSEAL